MQKFRVFRLPSSLVKSWHTVACSGQKRYEICEKWSMCLVCDHYDHVACNVMQSIQRALRKYIFELHRCKFFQVKRVCTVLKHKGMSTISYA